MIPRVISHVPVCPLFCRWSVNDVWEMGHYPTPLVVGALLHNRPHIILTFAPTAALLGFSILQVWTVYSILLSMMHNEIGVEMTRCCSPTHWLQLNTLVKSVLRRQPCRSAVLRSGKQWLLLTCWSFCRQREHEMTWSCPYFSHCPVCVCFCVCVLGDLHLIWRLV